MNLHPLRALRTLLPLLTLLLLLSACQRGGEPFPTPPPGGEQLPTFTPGTQEQVGTPGILPESPPTDTEPLPTPPSIITPAPEQPAPTTRFTNLRFAATSTGPEQSNFPVNTEEVCAIWDYRDMQASDTMERVWYLNDSRYVERREAWDLTKYGAQGTVRDICLFDRIDGYIDGSADGIDPGQWRVEIYLNGVQELSQQFTVGGP